MAGLDFSPLIENAFDPLKALQAYGKAQTTKLEGLKTQRQEQTRVGVGQSLARRDLVGARTTALKGGDTGLADAIGKLSDDERKATADGAQAFGSAAYALRQVPKEQRAQAFDQGVGALAGIVPPEQLAQARAHLEQTGWDDAAVDGYINAATTVDKLLAAQPKPTSEMQNLAAAGIRPDDPRYQEAILGNVNPSQFMEFGSDATGRQLIQTRGMGVGGGASTPAAPGGAGSPLSVRLNNPGAIRFDPANQWQGQTGSSNGFAQFDSVENGQRAQQKLLGNYLARGDNTPSKITARYAPASDGNNPQAYAQAIAASLGIGVDDPIPPSAVPQLAAAMARVEAGGSPSPAQASSGGPRVVAQTAPVAPKPDEPDKAPSGYRWAPDGSLKPIPGGPADPAGAGNKNTTSNRKAEADFRKEFDSLPEVKNFKLARTAFQQIRALTSNPNATAQDDMAAIFTFMKTLDPTSTVREGEYASARNAAGIPERVRTYFNRAASGNNLSPQQRKEMAATAARVYIPLREQYNSTADRYREYATDNGVSPDRVARKYHKDSGHRAAEKAQISPTIRRID